MSPTIGDPCGVHREAKLRPAEWQRLRFNDTHMASDMEQASEASESETERTSDRARQGEKGRKCGRAWERKGEREREG